MASIYDRIGYIGMTADGLALAQAAAIAYKASREQIVWSGSQGGEAAAWKQIGVEVFDTVADFTSQSRLFLLMEGSNPSDLDKILPALVWGSVCVDFSDALPVEKFRRGQRWEAAGGFYVDGAFEKSLEDSVHGGITFCSGRGVLQIRRSLYRVLQTVHIPGEAGEATIMRLTRRLPAGAISELQLYAAYFHRVCQTPAHPPLFPDQPENSGVEHVLKRARQMTEVQWHPRKPLPKTLGLSETEAFSPMIPSIGLPYSSARMEERFIGPNVSEDTFFSALEDENSILYTRDIRHHGNAAAYYGSVCSVFVGEAIGLKTRVPTKLWSEIPGMHLIEPNDVSSLKLADTLLNEGHVVIVTGIDRTADGKVYQVHISESVHPQCVCRVWRADEFTAYYLQVGGFRIYRYDGVRDVSYTPSPYCPLEGEEVAERTKRELLMNYGDKANCRLGEALCFTTVSDDWTHLRISRDGVQICLLPLEEHSLTYTPQTSGYYEVRGVRGEEEGPTVRFAVVSCRIETDKSSYALGEPILVTGQDATGAKPECAFLVYDGVLKRKKRETQHIQWFTPEEQCAGTGAVLYGEPGPYLLKVFFRNAYGVYSSDYISLEIREEPQ